MNQKKVVPSPQTQTEAMKIAKATQKQGQTKEQTKLIAQGIEKGIALYKKQQKEKQRQADKAKKKERKAKLRQHDDIDGQQQEEATQPAKGASNQMLPWALLVVSWAGFFAYLTAGQ